jgi:hypothetical protein
MHIKGLNTCALYGWQCRPRVVAPAPKLSRSMIGRGAQRSGSGAARLGRIAHARALPTVDVLTWRQGDNRDLILITGEPCAVRGGYIQGLGPFSDRVLILFVLVC